jgi:hypothetical protein
MAAAVKAVGQHARYVLEVEGVMRARHVRLSCTKTKPSGIQQCKEEGERMGGGQLFKPKPAQETFSS